MLPKGANFFPLLQIHKDKAKILLTELPPLIYPTPMKYMHLVKLRIVYYESIQGLSYRPKKY